MGSQLMVCLKVKPRTLISLLYNAGGQVIPQHKVECSQQYYTTRWFRKILTKGYKLTERLVGVCAFLVQPVSLLPHITVFRTRQLGGQHAHPVGVIQTTAIGKLKLIPFHGFIQTNPGTECKILITTMPLHNEKNMQIHWGIF